ncbi:hypothetical protein HDU85_004683 [Gaertneriomyces sp. JEL0708]|nr:hypothetical protein HDU85_004683 [Gaertneriomyces sp. JEL0708]
MMEDAGLATAFGAQLDNLDLAGWEKLTRSIRERRERAGQPQANEENENDITEVAATLNACYKAAKDDFVLETVRILAKCELECLLYTEALLTASAERDGPTSFSAGTLLRIIVNTLWHHKDCGSILNASNVLPHISELKHSRSIAVKILDSSCTTRVLAHPFNSTVCEEIMEELLKVNQYCAESGNVQLLNACWKRVLQMLTDFPNGVTGTICDRVVDGLATSSVRHIALQAERGGDEKMLVAIARWYIGRLGQTLQILSSRSFSSIIVKTVTNRIYFFCLLLASYPLVASPSYTTLRTSLVKLVSVLLSSPNESARFATILTMLNPSSEDLATSLDITIDERSCNLSKVMVFSMLLQSAQIDSAELQVKMVMEITVGASSVPLIPAVCDLLDATAPVDAMLSDSDRPSVLDSLLAGTLIFVTGLEQSAWSALERQLFAELMKGHCYLSTTFLSDLIFALFEQAPYDIASRWYNRLLVPVSSELMDDCVVTPVLSSLITRMRSSARRHEIERLDGTALMPFLRRVAEKDRVTNDEATLILRCYDHAQQFFELELMALALESWKYLTGQLPELDDPSSVIRCFISLQPVARCLAGLCTTITDKPSKSRSVKETSFLTDLAAISPDIDALVSGSGMALQVAESENGTDLCMEIVNTVSTILALASVLPPSSNISAATLLDGLQNHPYLHALPPSALIAYFTSLGPNPTILPGEHQMISNAYESFLNRDGPGAAKMTDEDWITQAVALEGVVAYSKTSSHGPPALSDVSRQRIVAYLKKQPPETDIGDLMLKTAPLRLSELRVADVCALSVVSRALGESGEDEQAADDHLSGLYSWLQKARSEQSRKRMAKFLISRREKGEKVIEGLTRLLEDA